MMSGAFSGWGGIGMVFMGLFWIAIIGLVVWAATRLIRQPQIPAAPEIDSARHILDRRLAAGEVSVEQYAELRRVLDGRSADSIPQ